MFELRIWLNLNWALFYLYLSAITLFIKYEWITKIFMIFVEQFFKNTFLMTAFAQ